MPENKKQVYLWHGANDFEISEQISAWSRIFKKKYSSLNILFFDFDAGGRDELYGKIKNALQVDSLFGLNKFVVFKNFLSAGNRLDEEIGQLIADSLRHLSTNFFIIFSENELSETKSVIYQAIQELVEARKAEIKKFDLPKANQLASWIMARAKKYRAIFSPEAINLLAAAVGNDLWQIDREIHKLANYKKDKILGDDISALVRGKYNDDIFELTDALSAKNAKKAGRLIVEQIKSGANEMYLLTMLARQFRIFLQLQDLLARGTVSAEQAASLLKIHPYAAKKSLMSVKNFSFEQLKKIYRRLLDIEYRIKTGASDFETEFSLLIAEL